MFHSDVSRRERRWEYEDKFSINDVKLWKCRVGVGEEAPVCWGESIGLQTGMVQTDDVVAVTAEAI